MKFKYSVYSSTKNIVRNASNNIPFLIIFIIAFIGLILCFEFSNSIKATQNDNSKQDLKNRTVVVDSDNVAKDKESIEITLYNNNLTQYVSYIEITESLNIILINQDTINIVSDCLTRQGYSVNNIDKTNYRPHFNDIVLKLCNCLILITIIATQLICIVIVIKKISSDQMNFALLKCCGYRLISIVYILIEEMILICILALITSLIFASIAMKILNSQLKDYMSHNLFLSFNTVVILCICIFVESIIVGFFASIRINKVSACNLLKS